jgi:hypothetical protein
VTIAVRPVPSIPWVTSCAVEDNENPEGDMIEEKSDWFALFQFVLSVSEVLITINNVVCTICRLVFENGVIAGKEEHWHMCKQLNVIGPNV